MIFYDLFEKRTSPWINRSSLIDIKAANVSVRFYSELFLRFAKIIFYFLPTEVYICIYMLKNDEYLAFVLRKKRA